MANTRFIGLLLILLCGVTISFADMAPEPGYKRVELKLVIEGAADFPDYRFFLVSGNRVEGLDIEKGKTTTRSALGGGAWFRNGTVVAIPRSSLTSFDQLSESDRKIAIDGNKLTGQIKLIQHGFVADVPEREVKNYRDSHYKIESNADGTPKATLISGPKTSNGPGKVAEDLHETGPLTWATIGGGAFLSLALVGFGIVWFRRSRR
jgi:hypothetical protein